jgi:hypothetical protein
MPTADDLLPPSLSRARPSLLIELFRRRQPETKFTVRTASTVPDEKLSSLEVFQIAV